MPSARTPRSGSKNCWASGESGRSSVNAPADAFDRARGIVEQAITSNCFPAAAVDIGSSTGTSWREVFGTLTFDAAAAPTTRETLFDLASLTKVVATTTLVMAL